MFIIKIIFRIIIFKISILIIIFNRAVLIYGSSVMSYSKKIYF